MDILKFKLFCIEMYKVKYCLDGNSVIQLFNEYNVLTFINDCYDVLHTLDEEVIVEDIYNYIENRKKTISQIDD